jgi:type I restriction enzyme S subunit
MATDDVSDYKVIRRGQIAYNPYVIWEGAIHILDEFEAGLVSPVYPVAIHRRQTQETRR